MKSTNKRLKEFGARVRSLRKKKGLTQENLAEHAGLHYTYIGGIERGERNLSFKSIERIADALDVNLTDLFFLWDKEGNKNEDKKDEKVSELLNKIRNAIEVEEESALRFLDAIEARLKLKLAEWLKYR